MAQRQFNIRIEEKDFDVLVAVAALDDSSPPDVVRGVLRRYVRKLEEDPDVREVVDRRRDRARKRHAQQAEPVSSLDAKRTKRGRRQNGA